MKQKKYGMADFGIWRLWISIILALACHLSTLCIASATMPSRPVIDITEENAPKPPQKDSGLAAPSSSSPSVSSPDSSPEKMPEPVSPVPGSNPESKVGNSFFNTLLNRKSTRPPIAIEAPVSSSVPNAGLPVLQHAPSGLKIDFQIGGLISALYHKEVASPPSQSPFYIATGRFLRVVRDDGQLLFTLPLSEPIATLSSVKGGAHTFLVAQHASGHAISIIEHVLESEAGGSDKKTKLVLKGQRASVGTWHVIGERLFEQTGDALSAYELDDQATIIAKDRYAIQANDVFYPLEKAMFIYRRDRQVLELWRREASELLASIPLSGEILPLAVVPQKSGSANGFLYFTNGTSPLSSLVRIPIELDSGRFLGPKEAIPVPEAFKNWRVHLSKGLLYGLNDKRHRFEVWSLERGERLPLSWPESWLPYPDTAPLSVSPDMSSSKLPLVSGSKIALLAVDHERLLNPEPVLVSPFQSRLDVTSLYVSASGYELYLVGKDDREETGARGFKVVQTEGTLLSSESPLWTTPSGLAQIDYVDSLWTLTASSGATYVSKEASPEQWTPLVWADERFPSSRFQTRFYMTPTQAWVSVNTRDASRANSRVSPRAAVLVHALLDTGSAKALGDRLGEVIDLESAYDTVALNREGRYAAVAAGAEGVVILEYNERERTVMRVHRKEARFSTASCERVALSPEGDLLVALCRDLRDRAQPKLFLNFYNVSDPRFPVFLSQVRDIPFSPSEEMPSLSFANGGDRLLLALGTTGLGVLDLLNVTAPQLVIESFSPYPVRDVDVGDAGTRVCLALGEGGLACGRFSDLKL